jgi:hypothetical protein
MLNNRKNIYPKKDLDAALEKIHKVDKKTKLDAYLNESENKTFRSNTIGKSDYDKNLNLENIDTTNEQTIDTSINEHRANEQSWQAHLGIGAVRTVAKAATEVAKLPGVIGGIAMSPFADENEGFETAFNNQWIKFFDGLNEDVKEALPVYIKESVKNGDFFTKIGSSAFYATEGADGAGFMLGAMAPGALFKLFGGANALFGASIKAAKLAKYGEGIEAGRKALKAANITIKNIDQYMIPAFNTIAESGAESKGVWDGMESRKGDAHKEYMSKLDPNNSRYQQAISLKNEQLDQLRRSGEISIEEYNQQSANIGTVVAEEMFEKDFKEQKALAAQNSFFKNVVIVAGPNYIQAKLLFGKTPSKVLLDKIGGLGEKTIKNTVKQGVKNFAKGFASEGAEEVGQTAVEHRNIEQGLKFKLGDDMGDDYNPLTFGEDFIKTLGTTEGQIAGFLGGIMGAPMSAVGGYKQDVRDRKQTERLREKINGASTAYADIKNTNIYEQEEYTNPETGEVDFRDKEVDGKKVFIPENVAKVKKALDLIERDSQIYDKAIEEGDTETIEMLKGKAEFNLINKFIGEDEVTLDALGEYLKVAFPTQKSENISEEQIKLNKENLERVDKIMKKATSLQKDLTSYKDMAASLIRINNPEVTEKHLTDFMNRVANTFISERAEEFDAKDKLNKLEKQKSDLLSNSTVIEIDNPNYIEGISSELDKTTKTRSNNPRLDLINSQIAKVKEQLKDFEEATNSTIWDNEYLNNKISNEVKVRQKLQKATSPEVVEKADEVLQTINNATTPEELNNLPKTNTPADTVIQQKADKKKTELKAAKEAEEAGVITNAKEDDNAFNGTSTTETHSTEGSDISDELTPQTGENTTEEDDKESKLINPTQGKGVKLISYDRKNNEVFSWIKEQFPEGLAFERNPINKIGQEVSFEINENPTGNSSVLEIEKRRKNDIERYDESDKRGIEKINPDAESTKGSPFKVGAKWNDGYKVIINSSTADENYIGRDDPYIVISKIIKPAQFDESGIMTKAPVVDVMLFNTKEEADKFIKERLEKVKLSAGKRQIKANEKYDAEIKALPQNKSKVSEALTAFSNKDFSNIQLLIDYLPINIKLAEGAYLPIETRRVNGEMNPETEMLRKSLITNLINGIPIESMNSTITGQYKGVLQVESPIAENSLLDLTGVTDLKYIKENTYFVNIHGQLENILTGQTRAFQNKFTKDLDRTKNYAAGEIYLMIPQADGISQFPLKLNISKLSIEESEGLFEIYREILTQDKGSNTTLSEISPELLSIIQNVFGEELKVITTPAKQKDIKLGEIIDLLVYESDKIKSRINVTEGILYFGDKSAHSGEIDALKEDIMYFLHTQKRHQIKIRPKSAEDNQRTNLSANSADYIKYLVESKILSTNAVVNQPLFQGYTNLFISPAITTKGVEIKSSNIKNINDKIEEIVNRGESEKIYRDTITEEDRNKKIDFDSLMSNISKSLTGEKEEEILKANKLLKQYLKEIHPDKIQNLNNKELSEVITTAMIIVAKKGNISKINELYNLYNNSLLKSKPSTKVKEYTETEVIERIKGIRTIDELKEGYESLSKSEQDLYKPLFTEKRIKIENKGEVSNLIIETKLDINENKVFILQTELNQKLKELEKEKNEIENYLVNRFSQSHSLNKNNPQIINAFTSNYQSYLESSDKAIQELGNKMETYYEYENNKKYLERSYSGKIKDIKIELEKESFKVSDSGAEIASNNFEGLDFGDNKVIIQPIVIEKDDIKSIRKIILEEEDYHLASLEIVINRELEKGISEYNVIKALLNASKLNDKQDSFGEILHSIKMRDNNERKTPGEKRKNAKYDTELAALENNSDNTRNIENNSVSLPESTTVIEDLSDSNKFVSSSDIPNTVENKQQMDKQNQVFKEPKGLEGQKDTKTIVMLNDKVEKGTATEANLKQLESLKDKYGEEYIKKCK